MDKILRYKEVLTKEQSGIVKNSLTNSSRNWVFQVSFSDGVNKSDNMFFYSALGYIENNFLLNSFYPYVLKNSNRSVPKFDRSYINCYPAFHPGDWHTDSDTGLTLLYYPDMSLDYETCGGTEFEDRVEPYISNSLLIFPANLLHRAQQHQLMGKFRFTIAFKFL